MDRFNPTWRQHWPGLGSTSASTAPTSLRPNLDRLGPNFGPTRLEDGAPWPQSGPIWEQLRPKVKFIWLQNGRYSRPNPTSSNRPFSRVFSLFLLSMTCSLKQGSLCCVSVGPNLVRSCRQRCQAAACWN